MENSIPIIKDSVAKQVTYLIIPFTYNRDYKKSFQDSMLQHWHSKKHSLVRLFKHIDCLITCDKTEATGSIGKRYILSQEGRKANNLPQNKSNFMTFYVKEDEFNFTINEVELYLFETQVGFLVFEIGHKKGATIEDIANSNYHMKKFFKTKSNKMGYYMKYIKKLSADEEEEIALTFRDLADMLLKDFQAESYFEANKKAPYQALVYNSVIFYDSLDDDYLKEYLFRMRHSFKDSYRPSKEEFDLVNNPEILQLFDNSYWGISLEGVANIVHLTDEEETDKFFTSTYFGYLKNTYLYMYILILHQRYALLYLLAQASLIPNNIDDYMKKETMLTNEGKSIFSLKEKITFYKLRCTFKHITNINHQKKLYNMLRNTLGIEDLMTELDNELEGLASLTALKEQKKKKQEDQRKYKANILIAFISTIFVAVSTFDASWASYLKFIETGSPPGGLILATVIFVIFAFYFFFDFFKKR